MERKNRKRKNPNVHVLQYFGLYNKYHLLDYKIKKVLGSSKSKDLKNFGKRIPKTKKHFDLIFKTLNQEAPVQINKGSVIIDNFSKELDELRSIHESGKEYLDQILERETEKTKIPSLKISFNNVFACHNFKIS